MEWQVGQWVECVSSDGTILEAGQARQISEVRADGYLAVTGIRGMWWDQSRFKPFTWQVGKTYRTTLEGVTATIGGFDRDKDVVGQISGNDGLWAWNPATGRMVEYEDATFMPHLLPFLADEPSEPDPTLTERFTVEQSGDGWLVRDHQDGRVARFSTQDAAEYAIGMIKEGENVFSWSSADAATQPQQGERDKQPTSRYHRTIKGVVVDLYDIAEAYGVTGHAEFHALKKIIMAGNRGYKDREQDLAEAIVSIERARELSKGGAE